MFHIEVLLSTCILSLKNSLVYENLKMNESSKGYSKIIIIITNFIPNWLSKASVARKCSRNSFNQFIYFLHMCRHFEWPYLISRMLLNAMLKILLMSCDVDNLFQFLKKKLLFRYMYRHFGVSPKKSDSRR